MNSEKKVKKDTHTQLYRKSASEYIQLCYATTYKNMSLSA